jgi:hypothetical protein
VSDLDHSHSEELISTRSVHELNRNQRAVCWLAHNQRGHLSVLRRSLPRGSVSTPVLLLIISLASLATILCYRVLNSKFDSELRSVVRRELSEIFPLADIFVGRVSLDGPNAIVITDVRMAMRAEKKRQQVLSAEQVVIRGQLDISSFLQKTATIEQVQMIGVQVDAWPTQPGRWSFDCLKAHPRQDRPPPEIFIERSSLRVRQSPQSNSLEIILHDIQATISPLSLQASIQNSGHQPRERTFLATCSGRSSGLLQELNLECQFTSSLDSIEVSGNFANLHFSKRFLELLPKEFEDRLTQLAGLECEASSNYFRMSFARDQQPEFVCQGRIQSGRLKDHRLPYPLERISSNFFCKNSLLQVRGMRARSGQAELKFEADIMGLALDSPMVIEAEVDNLDLDQRLYQSLPDKFQQHWDRLQLAGRISGSLRLSFDGLQWQPSADFRCQQINIRPWLFPYPLTQIDGSISYHHGTLLGQNLQGKAGGQLVESEFELSHVESDWYGNFRCRSLGAIVIDEELIGALTPEGQPLRNAENFVRSLQLSGAVELIQASFERPSLESPEWKRTIDTHLYGGRLQYKNFPYPVYNIRGRILNRDHQWFLEGFEGRNDSARILCTGTWDQVESGEVPFKLHLEAHSVPMAEDLFLALPANIQRVWSHLQPTGSVSRVSAVIQRASSIADIDTRVIIVEDGDNHSSSGRSLRLEPHDFPYLLSNVRCHAVYEDGVVTIQKASAQHGATRLALHGQCQSLPDSSWQADIQWLPTTRIMVDSQLVRALPKSIQESMLKLDFRGPVSLLGNSQIVFGDLEKKPSVQWNCQLDIEDGQLGQGQNVGSMRGTIWAHGSSLDEQLSASGNVSMDALRILNIPVTSVRGPFVLLDNKLYFGSAVQKGLQPSDLIHDGEITASALAGTLRLSGSASLDTGKVHLDAALENAHLSTLLQELGMRQEQPDAMCNAYLKDFRGVPWNSQTFHGSGSIHLTDAKLYELPFMMRLFSVASVNANDASAFQRADIGFRIDGDHIPLTVAADGEVLRLRGEGWTNLRRDVDLQLYTYVGRRLPISQLVSPLLAESRFATFMMVEVSGTLDNPQMQRRPFPQIEATFQQIFPEVADRRPFRDTLDRWRN